VTLRICMMLPEYTGFGGGIMTYYRHLAPALVRAGAEVTVIEGSGYASAAEPLKLSLEGVQVEVLESARVAGWFERLSDLTAVPTLRRNLAAAWASWEQAQSYGPFDIIEATDFGLLMIPPIMEAKIPVVMQLHGSVGQIHSFDPMSGEELAGPLALAMESAVAPAAAAVQTHSRANAVYWARSTGRMDIDLLLPAWVPIVTDRVFSDIQPVICVFGRIQMWKGPRILSEALTLLPDCPVVHWYGRDVINSETGRGTTKDQLASLFPEIWESRIKTYAPVSPDTVQALQSTSLLNLIPSTWDVFNFTVIEAMASGRPVVCSDRAGASELIEDGVTGFVYDGTSSTALADTLRRALSHSPQELAEIGAKAKARIVTRLDPNNIAQERLAAYRAVVGAKVEGPKIPEWIWQLVQPRNSNGDDFSFLDKLPLRPLANYIVRRVAKKLGLTS
jgi:glycosyltransferase involved in cell wall biosynthesis